MRWEIVLAEQRRIFEDFLQDCINGDLDKIARANVSLINNPKSLIFAIVHHLYDVLQLLLDKGVSPNIRVDWGDCPNNTPLIIAALKGDLESVKILIDYGADVNLINGADRDLQIVFDNTLVMMNKPSDDLYIKPVKQRTAEEIDYIEKYELRQRVNIPPVRIAYKRYHDNIVDYLLSRGAVMTIYPRYTEIFPFPFTTLDEMLRRCNLYFIKEVGLCEERYSVLRTQVRESERTKELLKDYEIRNSVPYPYMFVSTAILLLGNFYEFTPQYIALCSLFILEYWNETINSKTHIAAYAKVDDIGYQICNLIKEAEHSEYTRQLIGLK